MSRLYLLRHAKAGWAAPGMRDFDRPLDETGLREASATGLAMRAHGFVPDLTLCSNARRARETLEAVGGQADTGRVTFLDALYTEDAAGYMAIIRGHGRGSSLLIVGHNPMIEDLAMALAADGDPPARDVLSSGFPTSGLAAIRFEGDLSDAEPGHGHLEAFLTPGDL